MNKSRIRSIKMRYNVFYIVAAIALVLAIGQGWLWAISNSVDDFVLIIFVSSIVAQALFSSAFYNAEQREISRELMKSGMYHNGYCSGVGDAKEGSCMLDATSLRSSIDESLDIRAFREGYTEGYITQIVKMRNLQNMDDKSGE